MVSQPRQIFIGRDPEMAVLTSSLDDALSGRGQIVMLAGEPGIGKTRLAQKLASHAESSGAQVLWGWCYEHLGAPPYWPYVHPIRAYVETTDAHKLSSQMGSGGAAIAEIVPELRAKLPDLGQPLATEPEQARFRLFDSVATFLKNAAQSQPLLFVVDDLHWADESSLLMLEFLAREITASPLLILGTYRDVEVTGRHPLARTLGNLVREQHFRRVQLGGLTQHEVGEFVEANAGVSLPVDALETIHSRTDGNPLFVSEVVELIDPDLFTENRAWAEIIPAGVRNAIGSRLRRLSETCNQVLGSASVIGREFDFSLLRTLDSGIGADGVLEALDEASEAKVIEPLPATAGRYQFVHGLIQQTLYGEMSSIRRLRAHASIGETLEQIHQTALEAHAALLARHFAEAVSVLGPEKLARYSLLAGEQALATYAWEEALAHFERGLGGVDSSQLADETAALLFGLGQAQVALLQIEEAVVNLRRTFDYFSQSGNVDQAVAVACFPLPYVTARLEGVTQMVADALELVQPNSRQAALLLSRYGVLLHSQYGNYAGAEKAFTNALEIAKKKKDEGLELRTLTEAAFVDVYAARWDEALVKSLNALELAKNLSDPRSEVIARYSAGISLIVIGDLASARRQFEAGLPVSEKVGDRFWLSRLYRGNMLACEIKGDWDGARSFSDRALEIWPEDTRAITARAKMEYELGDFARGERFLEKVLETLRVTPQGPSMDYCLAAICLAITDLIKGSSELSEIAQYAAESVLSFSTGAAIVPNFANAALGILVAILGGNSEAAREQYAARGSQRGFLLVNCGMVNDRYLGLLSQIMDNLDQAAVHFDGALSFCRKSGYRPELAWTCRDYADMLLERNGEGDRARAISLLEESIANASELGMRPLMESVAVLQGRAEAQPVQAPVYPDGLTQREVEVIQLIAAGKTNREIAEGLVISVRTVANHVNSILSKTASANRTEAAAYAARQRLVSW